MKVEYFDIEEREQDENGFWAYIRAKLENGLDIDVRLKFEEEGLVIDVFNNDPMYIDPIMSTVVWYEDIRSDDEEILC